MLFDFIQDAAAVAEWRKMDGVKAWKTTTTTTEKRTEPLSLPYDRCEKRSTSLYIDAKHTAFEYPIDNMSTQPSCPFRPHGILPERILVVALALNMTMPQKLFAFRYSQGRR